MDLDLETLLALLIPMVGLVVLGWVTVRLGVPLVTAWADRIRARGGAGALASRREVEALADRVASMELRLNAPSLPEARITSTGAPDAS